MLQKGFDQFAKLGCHWRYGRQLSAYLDSELNAHEDKIIAGHLHECARCRVSFEQLRFAKRALVEFEIPQTRRPLASAQVFQLPVSREDSLIKRFYSQRIAVPLPLAAGIVIVLIGAMLFAIGKSQQSSIRSAISVPPPLPPVIKVVDVPVERVVTRIVYSRRSGKRPRPIRKENGLPVTSRNLKDDIAQNAGGTVEWSDSTLKNFRPAASANLRVVKEHEK
jgi:Putative zinc-finger